MGGGWRYRPSIWKSIFRDIQLLPSFLAYFQFFEKVKVVLYHHTVCLWIHLLSFGCLNQSLWNLYYGTWARLNRIIHKFHLSVYAIDLLSLLGNGSVHYCRNEYTSDVRRLDTSFRMRTVPCESKCDCSLCFPPFCFASQISFFLLSTCLFLLLINFSLSPRMFVMVCAVSLRTWIPVGQQHDRISIRPHELLCQSRQTVSSKFWYPLHI